MEITDISMLISMVGTQLNCVKYKWFVAADFLNTLAIHTIANYLSTRPS